MTQTVIALVIVSVAVLFAVHRIVHLYRHSGNSQGCDGRNQGHHDCAQGCSGCPFATPTHDKKEPTECEKR